MPRYKYKRGLGLVRSGLSRLSVKNRRTRLRRSYVDGVQFNETVNGNDNNHIVEANREERVFTAAEGLLMLQANAASPLNFVWGSPKSGPFIVSPLHKRADITTNSSESKGENPTPPSSQRASSTPLSLLEFQNGDLSPKRLKRPMNLDDTAHNIYCTPEKLSNLTDSGNLDDTVHNIYCTPEKSYDLNEIVTVSVNSARSLETAVTRPDPSSNSAGSSTMSGETMFQHTGTQTDEHSYSVECSTMSGETAFEHSGTQTDQPSNFPGGTSFTGLWRYIEMRGLTRKEFHRLTGVNQENFEALYIFLGGDEVCNNLKYDYDARTPRKKRPSYLTVKRNVEDQSAGKTTITFLSSKDKLFMTLVRLRRGLAVEDAALLFGLSKTQASKIFYVWVQFMYLQFKRIQREMCVTRHDQPRWKIAPCFRAYKNFRMVLDTTEIRIQIPKHYRQQGNTYSSYKAWNVILYMIGISGWGSISFVSPGFEGSMSDRAIFDKSGLREYLEPGDLLLVDRGFTIKDIMDEVGVTVVHPPFTNKGKPLCPEDNMLTKRLGSDRSHVERAIRRIKCFNILKRATNKMLPILDQLVYVCACLTNFDANLLLV